MLEKKVELYKEQQGMFKVMMNDLELYKQKAEMSKQLATYFSPFAPITTFSQEQLFKQPQTKDGIIDAQLSLKNKDSDIIKKQEKEIINLREVKSQHEALKKEFDKLKKEFHSMEQQKEKYKNLSTNLEQEVAEQK